MRRLRINILYWLILPAVAYGIFYVNKHYSQQSATFFGFAENRETQINLENAVIVNRIAVTPGQTVKKGDLLLEVTRTALDLKLSDVAHNISELQVKDQMHRTDLRAGISRLQAQRAEKVNDLQSRIRALEAEIAFNESLVKDLKSIDVPEISKDSNNPNLLKINALREELKLTVQPLDVEIQRLEKELNAVDNPIKVEISRLKNEENYYKKEQQRLLIYAPSDGLVGTIHCKEGESISSFSTLISFYEKNPNMVVGYVHEGLILQVKTGDSLNVASSLHLEEQCRGKVIGMGHRIVEIPERLRKIPEIKTYGREVLIQIPSDNKFLQKEKVVLTFINPPEGLFNGFITWLSRPTDMTRQVN